MFCALRSFLLERNPEPELVQTAAPLVADFLCFLNTKFTELKGNVPISIESHTIKSIMCEMINIIGLVSCLPIQAASEILAKFIPVISEVTFLDKVLETIWKMLADCRLKRGGNFNFMEEEKQAVIDMFASLSNLYIFFNSLARENYILNFLTELLTEYPELAEITGPLLVNLLCCSARDPFGRDNLCEYFEFVSSRYSVLLAAGVFSMLNQATGFRTEFRLPSYGAEIVESGESLGVLPKRTLFTIRYMLERRNEPLSQEEIEAFAAFF